MAPKEITKHAWLRGIIKHYNKLNYQIKLHDIA